MAFGFAEKPFKQSSLVQREPAHSFLRLSISIRFPKVDLRLFNFEEVHHVSN